MTGGVGTSVIGAVGTAEGTSEVGAFEISPMGVLLFLAVGVGLFGVFQGARYLLRVARVARGRREAYATTLTVVETLVGLAYLVSAVPMLFSGRPETSPYFAALIVAVVLWVAWVAGRDLVHGVFFKAGRACRVGDRVELDGVEGRVAALGYRVLVLDQGGGKEARIPYAKAARATLTREPVDLGVTRHVFRVVPAEGVALSEAHEAARRAVFNAHWASPGHEAEVEVAPDGALEIGVYALDPLHAPDIEAAVRSALAR